MKKPPLPDWFRFHIEPYNRATEHLTTLQHGAYFLLIKRYYTAGSLPTDDRALASICKMSLHQWKSNKATLAAFFDENWKQDKCEEELQFFREKSEARAKAGAEGARAKIENDRTRKNNSDSELNHVPQIKSNEDFESKPLKTNKVKSANAVQSEPDFADRVKSQESKKESSSSKDARAPEPIVEPKGDDDDRIRKSKVKEALGPNTSAQVAADVMPVIAALEAEGCDFERDVLPKLRDIAKTKAGLKTPEPPFLKPQIRERRDARLAAPTVPTSVFVEFESPGWRAWVAAGHKASLHSASNANRGREGWWFASPFPPPPPGLIAGAPSSAVLH